MNCCNHNNDNKNNNSHKGRISHMWMMALCCGAPLLIIILISVFGANFPAIRSAILPVLPFICPIMMVVMMPMMFMQHNHNCNKEEGITDESKENNLKDNK
ncbi:MAG TPA: hypothetical protein VHP31_09275 [Caproicibacter sp.]|nr:hypothetical protein [Caproicibacter sp.]